MNKRRKAQLFSLMLALLMLASVVPGTLLKPVSAAGYITGVSAETNYGDSLLFNGFPYYVNVTINASQNTFANITLYYIYTDGSSNAVYSRIKPVYAGQNTVIINSSNPVDIPPEYENIPQNVTQVILQVWESVWNGNGYSNIGSPVQYLFTVKPPFNVTFTNITSAVPYYNGSAWLSDKIFEYIPFNATINVTYNPYLVNNSLVSVPAWQIVNISLPDGSLVQVNVSIDSKTDPSLIQNNTGSVDEVFNAVNASGNISVASTGGTYLYTNPAIAAVNPWWIQQVHWVVPEGANSTSPYKYVSFDLYTNVTTMSSFGILGINDTATVAVTGGVVNNANSSTIINGTGQVVVKGLKVDPATAAVTLASYPVNTSFTITGTPWNIYVDSYAIRYGIFVSSAFYINVPSILNVTVKYNLTVVLNSTANYTIFLNGNKIANGTFQVINNVGSFEVPLTPDELGNVTVIINDTNYHVSTSLTLRVEDWNVTGAYKVYHYGIYEDRQFYIGIPADLYVNATFELPILLNSSVVVEVYAPDGTLIQNTTLPIINNTGEGIVLNNAVFNQLGYVTVKIYNSTYDVMDTLRIPVKDWGIYVDSTPKNLTVAKSTPLTVEVRESLYFPGQEPVNVKLYLPDGQVLSENITLQGSPYTANGGYYGVVTFSNVTPTLPGLAKVVVTDLTFGKKAVEYLPVYPNGTVTGKWIDVKATPEKSPVYAYVGNSIRLDLQYYYNMGEGAYKNDTNSYVNITIVDADGSQYTINNVPVVNGVVTIPSYQLPVNGTGDIYIEAVDAIDSSIRGVAEIPVQNWQVTFDINTNGPVYKYVDNMLKVTVHVPAGVAVDVNISGTVYTGVTDGQVISIPIVNPTSDIIVTAKATYHNTVANKDYLVGQLPSPMLIHVRTWHVELDYTPKDIYTYIPYNLTLKAIPVDDVTGQTLPFSIDLILYNETLDTIATGTNAITVSIEDDTGAGIMYFVDASYNGHSLLTLEPIEITTHDWYIDVIPSISSSAYSSSDYFWAGVPASITFKAVTKDADTNAQITLPVSIPIEVTYEGMNYEANNSVILTLTSPQVPSEEFQVEAMYRDISYNNTFVFPVKDWGIYVHAYPSKLYSGIPQNMTLIIGYSAGIKSTATVDVGGSTYTANVEPVGEDSAIAVVNVGEVTATQGYLKVTVTDQYGKSATLKIPVVNWSIAVTPNVNFLYTNVSSDVTVNVHYSDSMLDGKANVYLVLPDGTELEETAVIVDGQGSVTFTGVVSTMPGNITVYAEDVASGKTSPTATIEVHDWHIETSISPTEWYTYMPQNYEINITYIDDVTMGIANIDADIVVSYNLTGVVGNETTWISSGRGSVTLCCLATPNAGVGTFTVTDVDHGKSTTLNVLIHGWSVKVTYPEELYVAPGYKNPIVVGFEYIADNNETVPYTGNTTIEIQLPGNITLEKNTNASPADFGSIELNESNLGTGNITVYANDYPAVEFTGTIEVKKLLEMSVLTPRIYENVPTEVMLNITYNGGDYHNLQVYVEGQNITFTTNDGQIWMANVTLPAGNYTVVAHDDVYNVTVTGTFHVAPWHLEITPSTTSIPAGTIENINFTVRAIDDETNGTADINAPISVNITFSNQQLIPKGTFTVANFSLINGEYTFTKALFAPAPGNFTVKAVAKEYNKCAKTTIEVTKPAVNPTWVYVDIVKEGTLEAPNDTVVIYWSIDGNVYFPAYDYIKGQIVKVNATAVNGKVVFPLYPVNEFNLYLIAVPEFIAEKYPILTPTAIDKTVTTVKTWYNYSVEAVNDTITASAIVYKKTVTEGWTYQIPQAPGYIAIKPPASVYGLAPYTPYDFVYTENIENATNSTSYTFTFSPETYLEFIKKTNLAIQPAQYGSYFKFMAKLYERYVNVSGQFDEQFMTFENQTENMVNSLPYLTASKKQELAQEIINEAAGYKSNITSRYTNQPIPISNATIQVHIDNPAIAYVEPVNATTNANGTACFKVYSAAPQNATPEELIHYMGDLHVWATYDGLTSENYTISFGGIGSISGDVVDPNNNLLPGATVELFVFENGNWVAATDYAGKVLKTIADGHGHYSFNVPASLSGTKYRVVAHYGGGVGYADTTVYPFVTSTADVVVTTTSTLTGLGAFITDAQTHNTMVVLGSDALKSVDYQAMSFLFETIGVKPTYTANDINLSSLNSNDMIIAVGGPEVNSITAHYQNLGEAKMVVNSDGSISIVADGTVVANWTAPAEWWNVSEGYWIIQKVVDNTTGAVIYMIYGTDADSTWAAAYYFSQHFSELNGKNYVVGIWKDTDGIIYSPGFLKFTSNDHNGFSPGDLIKPIAEG